MCGDFSKTSMMALANARASSKVDEGVQEIKIWFW
jgi:hypothetical protein